MSSKFSTIEEILAVNIKQALLILSDNVLYIFLLVNIMDIMRSNTILKKTAILCVYFFTFELRLWIFEFAGNFLLLGFFHGFWVNLGGSLGQLVDESFEINFFSIDA